MSSIPGCRQSPGPQDDQAGTGRDKSSSTVSLTVEYLVPSAEGVIGDVEDIAVSQDGRVYVADAFGPTVWSFEPDGSLARKVGRPGKGPGEFGRVTTLGVDPDGRLLVWDDHAVHWNVYGSDGHFVESFRPNGLGRSTLHVDEIHVGHDGYLYLEANDWTRSRREGESPEAYFKTTLDGEIIGSIQIPFREDVPARFVIATTQGMLENFVRGFRHAFSPLGYLVVGHNAGHEISVMDPEASTRTFEVEHDASPVRLGALELEQWRAIARRLQQGSPSTISRFVTYDVPLTKPVFSELHVGEQGLIWVQRYVEAVERSDLPQSVTLTWRQQSVFDVYEPSGRLLGTVELPWDTMIYVRRGRQLWGTQTDSSGNRVVVQLQWTPEESDAAAGRDGSP